jgi:hypothetical protein
MKVSVSASFEVRMQNVILLLTKVRPNLSTSVTGGKAKLSLSVIKLSAKEAYGKEKI